MKLFHTADWHLGKLVQGVYMTEDQGYVLDQFIEAIKDEKPDAVIIAGDIYDRAVPPTDAVQLLDNVLKKIVIDLKTPVLAVAGNHDSPGRIHFASQIMKENGLHLVGRLSEDLTPIVLDDEYGEVHFHLIPYCDPSVVRNVFQDDEVKTHNDAARKIVERITDDMDDNARHVYIGHAFVTPYGEEQDNTSESERPLSIGGAEHVDAQHFSPFHYTALGHLHRAHAVKHDHIKYAGSLLKYSISEEHHKKGFYIVELDETGKASIEKRLLEPRRDMRTIESTIKDLYTHEINDDYVFVRLLDEAPVLSPMEKVRSVYPNAMHVARKNNLQSMLAKDEDEIVERTKMSDLELFHSFYETIKGETASTEVESIFKEVLDAFNEEEREATPNDKEKETVTNE